MIIEVSTFSVAACDGRFFASAPGDPQKVLARLKRDDPIWEKPSVCLHETTTWDVEKYRLRPSDRLHIKYIPDAA